MRWSCKIIGTDFKDTLLREESKTHVSIHRNMNRNIYIELVDFAANFYQKTPLKLDKLYDNNNY